MTKTRPPRDDDLPAVVRWASALSSAAAALFGTVGGAGFGLVIGLLVVWAFEAAYNVPLLHEWPGVVVGASGCIVGGLGGLLLAPRWGARQRQKLRELVTGEDPAAPLLGAAGGIAAPVAVPRTDSVTTSVMS